MIVVEAGAELRLVTQSDHAHLAAELLALVPALADEPYRNALLRATRRHDDGWQGVDAAPPVRDDGRPHDFLSLPWSLRAEVWDRGTTLADIEPEAALLIAEHALYLHRDHRPDRGSGKPLVERLEERRRVLREELGEETSGELAALYPWLRAVDLLSLIVVNRWRQRHELRLPGASAAGRAELDIENQSLLLDPFPLAGTTSLHYSERCIENRRYADSVDLGVELASARWVSSKITLKSLLSGWNDRA